ncbi:MAG: aminotransferase class V-fold PLP-dependent enzyme, partial [Nanoarchaeota archaeon]|nr:aminotransferase class V-fold PLP-dependent enzyme [Nanoarchaeota archaeon]
MNHIQNYIPNTEKEQEHMLEEVGVRDKAELYKDISPDKLLKQLLDLPTPMSELELKKFMTKLSNKNCSDISVFRGAGSYNHFSPSVVNHIISRSEFYTGYTPYQPEMSQGILQAIYEYQSMICSLTGMEIANASMYDGASSLAEAMAVVLAAARGKKNTMLVSKAVHPNYRKVLRTYAEAGDVNLVEIESEEGTTSMPDLKDKLSEDVAGVIIQSPNFFGIIEEVEKLGKVVHENNADLVVNVAEASSFGLLKAPG